MNSPVRAQQQNLGPKSFYRLVTPPHYLGSSQPFLFLPLLSWEIALVHPASMSPAVFKKWERRCWWSISIHRPTRWRGWASTDVASIIRSMMFCLRIDLCVKSFWKQMIENGLNAYAKLQEFDLSFNSHLFRFASSSAESLAIVSIYWTASNFSRRTATPS